MKTRNFVLSFFQLPFKSKINFSSLNLILESFLIVFIISAFVKSTVAGNPGNSDYAKADGDHSSSSTNSDRMMYVKFALEGYYAIDDIFHIPSHSCTDNFTFELWESVGNSCVITETHTASVDQYSFIASFPLHVHDGTYFLKIKHRNGLATWSQSFVINSLDDFSYDFTNSSTKAFGNNMIYKEVQYGSITWGQWCFYSGDINHDEYVGLADVLAIHNAATYFTVGYVDEDVDCDEMVTLADLIVAYNNMKNFVSTNSPCN